MEFSTKERYGVEDLRALVAFLRAPGGCSWDAAQTHQSIRRNLIEETYEVCDAIDQEDAPHLQEELGDLLFSVVNVARFLHVSAEQSLSEACEKFIRRFQKVEELANARGVDMQSAGIDALDKLWEEAKKSQA